MDVSTDERTLAFGRAGSICGRILRDRSTRIQRIRQVTGRPDDGSLPLDRLVMCAPLFDQSVQFVHI
ncbi:hypothetical protein XH79_23805 [Bradyrhizobium sp. CCBAU 45389]|nr:hypothetical protein [Bradyrhizobium sp. CCBAU 45389]